LQGSRLQQGVLCPAHLTLQQAVLRVTCSLLCRSLICAPVLAGRHREVSQIRKIRVAKLNTRRFGHGCVVCGRFRKVRSSARGFSIAWKVLCMSGAEKQGHVWFYLGKETLCPFGKHTTTFQFLLTNTSQRVHTNTSWRAFPAPQN
jgi:hypothetical protein